MVESIAALVSHPFGWVILLGVPVTPNTLTLIVAGVYLEVKIDFLWFHLAATTKS